MKVQVQYPGGDQAYTFDAPEGTQVGDLFHDNDTVVEVVALDPEFMGDVRGLADRAGVAVS
jgi:hypothetical protein